MKLRIGLLAAGGALLLFASGCQSTEEKSFQVTPLTQDEQSVLEQIGEKLFTAVTNHDYSAAKTLFADDFSNNSESEEQFEMFCSNFDACGKVTGKQLVTTVNREPFKLLIYKLSFEQTVADAEGNEIIVPQERLFVMGMGNIDGKLAVVDFRPVL